jgi:hypothetical protein
MPDYVVVEPGVYDIPEDVYHRDPVRGGSLSYSGAKKLLAEGGPELYRYEAEHPPEPTQAMELGTAAHKLVLGVGQELHEVKADNWRGKKASDDADAARADGKLPLLTKELAVVTAMAARLREHERASQLLAQPGRAEMSAFWTHPGYEWQTPDGVKHPLWWRCRWDYMPEPDPRYRPVIGDYKTCKDASPRGFAKAVADYRYYLQAHVYGAGYAAMFADRIAAPPGYALIAQERTAPYRVAVYELHPDALRKGRQDAERAMEIYRDNREAEAEGRPGAWPGYSPEIEVIDLPYWAYREEF